MRNNHVHPIFRDILNAVTPKVQMVDCPDCDGEGKVEALQPDRFPFKPDAAQVWKWEVCKTCHGTGKVEEDTDGR